MYLLISNESDITKPANKQKRLKHYIWNFAIELI